MKKNKLCGQFLIMFLFFTQTAFSQLDDGNYMFSNNEIKLKLTIAEDGWKVTSATFTYLTANKTITGSGEWFPVNMNGVDQNYNGPAGWYQIQTAECNYEAEINYSTKHCKLNQFDCKNGIENKEYNLKPTTEGQVNKASIKADLPNLKAKAPTGKYKDWGIRPVESADGPPDMWTMPSQMCEGPQSESVKASTTLAPQGKYKYLASYVCDDDPTTAWVEGNADYGIGEFLEFNDWVPMGTGEISILNGYQSSKIAWENNSRVKKFKVSINGKEMCIIELGDVMGVQSFMLPANSGGSLRFTILEVYPGLKWKDTAISGIFSCGG
jgi:hypothetical protein